MKKKICQLALLTIIPFFVFAQEKETKMGLVKLVKSKDKLTGRPIHRIEEILPATFDGITQFLDEGYALAIINGKIGIIDTLGRTILPFEYDKVEQFDSKACIAVVNKKNSYSVVGKEGKQIMPPILSEDKYPRYKLYINERLIAAYPKGATKLYDYGGKLIIQEPIKSIQFLENDLLVATNVQDQTAVFDIKTGRKTINYGVFRQIWTKKGSNALILPVEGFHNVQAVLLDKNGRTVNPQLKFWEPYLFDEGPLILTHERFERGYRGAINEKGKIVIPFIYNEIKHIKDKAYKVTDRTDKVGVIDSGHIVVPIKYDDVARYQPERNVTIVKKGEKYGVVSNEGHEMYGSSREMVPPIYDKIDGFNAKGYSPVTLNGKMGIMDDMGNIVIPIEYDKVIYPDNNGVGVMKDGKWGILSLKNQFVLPLNTYDTIMNLNGGMFLVFKNKKGAFFDSKGQQQTGFKYTGVHRQNEKTNVWAVAEEQKIVRMY